MSNNWHKIFGLLLLVCSVNVTAWGQVNNVTLSTKINSPLSRFGIGDPVQQYFNHSAAMGGLSAGWQDPYRLNLQNPASLASLRWTAFEGGIYAKKSTYTSAEATDQTWGGNLQYLALGFPLRNALNQALDRESNEWNAGMSFALVPYSQVGYDIQLVDVQTPGVAQSTNTLKGAGGLTRFRWGTGFRYKQLSVGIDAGFVFGKIINSRLVVFDSLLAAFDTEFRDDLSIKATIWTGGAQYAFEFKHLDKKGNSVPSGKRVVLGVTLTNEASFKSTGTQFIRRLLSSVSDTIVFDDAIQGTGVLPAAFSVGIHYQNLNKLNIGLEYGVSTWGNYENSLKQEKIPLKNSYYIALGGEYIPKHNSYNRYWERIRYRAGFRYATDPRSLNLIQVEDYSFSLGFGLPVIMPRQQISFVNTSIELGRTGVTGVLEENYVRLNFGFTLNDNSCSLNANSIKKYDYTKKYCSCDGIISNRDNDPWRTMYQLE